MRAFGAAAIGFCMVLGAAASSTGNKLTVVVFDYAQTPHELLRSAAKEARHAFHMAGIETEWILCHPVRGCSVPDQYVEVKILAHPTASIPASAESMASTVTCNVAEHCSASYVFFERVSDFASGMALPPDLTLGYVMVHEIGHQMGLGHRPGGIMTAVFTAHDLERAASGWLFFAPDDVLKLRAAIARSQVAGNPTHMVRLPGIHTGAAE